MTEFNVALFAGKTESTKFLVQHLVHLCSHQTTNLHQRIIEVNTATFRTPKMRHPEGSLHCFFTAII